MVRPILYLTKMCRRMVFAKLDERASLWPMLQTQSFFAAVAFAVLAAPVFASCPLPTLDAPAYSATGQDLISPQSWEVSVQGDHPAPCDAWQEAQVFTGELAGFLPEDPTAIFELSGMAPHILMVMARAECTPVLAVRSGDGQWFFGETRNDRQEATLWGAPDGPLQVWVGTATGETCEGVVTLETFDR